MDTGVRKGRWRGLCYAGRMARRDLQQRCRGPPAKGHGAVLRIVSVDEPPKRGMQATLLTTLPTPGVARGSPPSPPQNPDGLRRKVRRRRRRGGEADSRTRLSQCISSIVLVILLYVCNQRCCRLILICCFKVTSRPLVVRNRPGVGRPRAAPHEVQSPVASVSFHWCWSNARLIRPTTPHPHLVESFSVSRIYEIHNHKNCQERGTGITSGI
ncbi:hypothetical protein LZ31DRAFT_215225 [Colletotrichum somersetense]|nr:hypothetical protein LZ31DRAFT_215225 [Colletotrichum somersetense]